MAKISEATEQMDILFKRITATIMRSCLNLDCNSSVITVRIRYDMINAKINCKQIEWENSGILITNRQTKKPCECIAFNVEIYFFGRQQ